MKDIRLNGRDLGMVQGGIHNPYFKLDCPDVKEYKMKDGRVIRGYVQAGLFVQIK